MPRFRQPVDGLAQLARICVEMDAQVLLAPPGGVQPAARQHRDAMPQGRLREGRAIAVRQAYPQGLPAAHGRRGPAGKGLGELGPQMGLAGGWGRGGWRGARGEGRRWGGGRWDGMFPPRSWTARSRASRAMTGTGARIQPIRSPAQTILLSEPTEITVSP